jgi:hypothetical protein
MAKIARRALMKVKPPGARLKTGFILGLLKFWQASADVELRVSRR